MVSTKKARLMLMERSFSPAIVETTLRNLVSNVKDVYELPLRVTVENKLRSFQYKLMHNIIQTNLSLYKMKIKESPHCEHCHCQNETLLHRFWECPEVKLFWEDVIEWWNTNRSENFNPTWSEILYGYRPENTSFHAFNHYLLIAKYHVYLARNQGGFLFFVPNVKHKSQLTVQVSPIGTLNRTFSVRKIKSSLTEVKDCEGNPMEKKACS